MGQDSTELFVAETQGHLYVASVGTNPPSTDATAWPAGWLECGYFDENGVQIEYSKTPQDIAAMQELDPIRIVFTARNVKFTVALRQWNVATLRLAFDGASIATVSAGHYELDLPDAPGAPFAAGLEFVDHDNVIRVIVPSGFVEDPVNPQFIRGGNANLAIGFRAVKVAGKPIAYLLSNMVSFAEAY
jgi:hypothetical protein